MASLIIIILRPALRDFLKNVTTAQLGGVELETNSQFSRTIVADEAPTGAPITTEADMKKLQRKLAIAAK